MPSQRAGRAQAFAATGITGSQWRVSCTALDYVRLWPGLRTLSVTSDKENETTSFLNFFFEGANLVIRNGPGAVWLKRCRRQPKALHSPRSGKGRLRGALLSVGSWPHQAAAAHTAVASVPDQCRAYSLASQPWKSFLGFFFFVKD